MGTTTICQHRHDAQHRSNSIDQPHLLVKIPQPGRWPSEFRRRFVIAIKRSIREALRAGRIDAAVAEELWRALPAARSRQ